jgi:hypothetical protein
MTLEVEGLLRMTGEALITAAHQNTTAKPSAGEGVSSFERSLFS